MNYISGERVWIELSPIPVSYPYVSDDINTEVAVIGGGITGAICAYYFTQAGIDTVLVDKNIIGFGSTSGSTSILQYEIDNDFTGLKGLLGEEKAAKAFRMTYDAVYTIKDLALNVLDDDCGFTEIPCFYYTGQKNYVNYINTEAALRQKNGFDVKLLDEKGAQGIFDFPVKAGILSETGAAYIDPYRFTHALIQKAVQRGLKTFENTEVINTDYNDSGVNLTTRNGFKINARKTIIASGFEGRNYIDSKTAILTRTFAVVTKPVQNFNGWYKKCIIRDNSMPYSYFLPTSDNRIITGGEDVKIGGARSQIANLTNAHQIAKDKYTRLFDRLLQQFPRIPNIEVDFQYSGYFAETKDGLPYVGEYGPMHNYYFCLGYGSNGILYDIIGAPMLVELFKGTYTSELSMFAIGR